MPRILIEGSVNPSTFLARGERTLVERSPFIDKLIKRGYVVVVESRLPVVDEVRTVVEDSRKAAVQAPPESAIKAVWQDFLDDQGIAYPATATKAELIKRWEMAQHVDQVSVDSVYEDEDVDG